MQLAIVIPCHNEERSLPALMDAIKREQEILAVNFSATVSLYFIDDGSTDETINELRRLWAENTSLHYASFSRNFGKEAALLAGLQWGLEDGADYLVVMDADLQDPPELLPKLINMEIETGVDSVAAYREDRDGEQVIKSWLSECFYKLMSHITEMEIRNGARDYRVVSRRMAQEVVNLPERTRFSKGLFMWVGYKTEWVGYSNKEREYGDSSWSLSQLFRYALNGILAFSTWPLEVLSLIGLSMSAVALIMLGVIVLRAAIFGDPVAGWPSMMSIITLFGGLQLLGIGTVGLYLAKAYDEVKQRPLYIVAEKDNVIVTTNQS